ncbi:hypothetical protein WG66_008266 [Moniliophthora roreri]|nr:hypothetical protein WG66_008266 [Moniliophthora roreri]
MPQGDQFYGYEARTIDKSPLGLRKVSEVLFPGFLCIFAFVDHSSELALPVNYINTLQESKTPV